MIHPLKLSWIIYNISLVILIIVPGLSVSTATISALPIILYAIKEPIKNSQQPILFLLFTVLLGVLLSGYLGANFESIYINFLLWILSAGAFYIFLSKPGYIELAIKVWAISILFFFLYRFSILLGLPRLPFITNAKNAVGIIISTFFPVAFVYYRYKLSANQFWILFAFMWLIILVNASRSSIMACSLTTLILINHLEIRHKKKYRYLLLVPLGIFLLVLFLPVIKTISPGLSQKIDDVETFFTADQFELRDVEANSFSLRFLAMEKAIDLFQEHTSFGVGLNHFTDFHRTDFDYFLLLERGRTGLNAHNSYLSMLSETGLLGSIPFFILILYLIYNIILALNQIKVQFDPYLLIAATMTIGILIELFFAYNIIRIITWSYLVILFAFRNNYREEKKKKRYRTYYNILKSQDSTIGV